MQNRKEKAGATKGNFSSTSTSPQKAFLIHYAPLHMHAEGHLWVPYFAANQIKRSSCPSKGALAQSLTFRSGRKAEKVLKDRLSHFFLTKHPLRAVSRQRMPHIEYPVFSIAFEGNIRRKDAQLYLELEVGSRCFTI